MAKAKQTVTVTKTRVKATAPKTQKGGNQGRCPVCGKFMSNG